MPVSLMLADFGHIVADFRYAMLAFAAADYY